jgi:hypothetical protein
MALIPYNLPLGAENDGSAPPMANPNQGWPFPIQGTNAQFPALPPNQIGWAPTSGPGYPTNPINNPVPAGARQAGGTPAMFASQGGGPLQAGGGVRSAVGRFGMAKANLPPGPPSYAEQAQLAVGTPAVSNAANPPDDQALARQRALMMLAQHTGLQGLGLGGQLSSLFDPQQQALPQQAAPQPGQLPGAPIPQSRRLG